MIATIRPKAAVPGALRHARAVVFVLLTAATLNVCAADRTRAEEAAKSTAAMEARVQALIPELEAYIQSGMKAFDVPGVAVGIVTGDRLVYAKGFGVRSKSGEAAVDPRTVFQIGSVAKGFPRPWRSRSTAANFAGTTAWSISIRTLRSRIRG
jgi:hypothetical protein